jgi:hypothetical protein
MPGQGDDNGGKKPLPLFEFGKGRARPAPKPRPAAPKPEVRQPEAARPQVPPRKKPVPSSGFQTPLYAPPKTPAAGFAPVAPGYATPKTPAAGFAPVAPGYATPKTPAAGFAPVGHASDPDRASVPSRGFENPLSADVVQWMQALLRAVRGRRLYPAGHAILGGYLVKAEEGLQRVLSKMSSLELRVREDRLFFDKDEVHKDSDRLEGLPFLLFSHSIQQIEFRAGMTGDELNELIEYLAADYRAERAVDEDLVAALWRINLPHFEYFVVDIYKLETSARGVIDPSAMLADDETRRIRAELGQIVAALQTEGEPMNAVPDDTLGSGEQFVADMDVADNGHAVDAWDVDAMLAAEGLEDTVFSAQGELRDKDSHDVLLSRLVELLVRALRAEAGEVQGTPGWGLLLGLLDAILRAHQFAELQRVIERLAGYLTQEPQLRDAGLKEVLMRHVGAPEAIQVILMVLDCSADPRETRAGFALLEYLGSHSYAALLDCVSLMNQPQARRMVIEQIATLVKDDAGEMLVALRSARAEVVREVLALGDGFPALVASGLVWLGSEDLETSVRSQAVGLLRGFSGHRADHMVARFMDDRESSVRMEAYRASAHRTNSVVLNALLAVVDGRELSDLEPGEIQALFGALAGVGGDKATAVLARVLTETSALGISRYGVDVRVAAAHALGKIGSGGAKKVLEGAGRSLNRRVKQACRLALEAKGGGALHLDLPTRFGELDPRPFELDRALPTAVVHSTEPAPDVPRSSAGVAPLEIPRSSPAVAPLSITAIPLPTPPRAPIEPPPLLDAGALRSASGSRLAAPEHLGSSVLEAPTLPNLAGAPSALPGRPDLAALVDDLSLFGLPAPPAPATSTAPPAPVAPPRLPSSALMAPIGEEDGE